MIGSWFLAAMAVGAVELHMSPTGDDRNSGTPARPVKTLARAIELLRANEKDAPKTIWVADGVYPFEQPVILTVNDFDITIRAKHARKAVFTGAVRLTGWRKDPADSRFLVADLPFKPKEGVRLTLTSSGEWRDIASYPDYPTGPVLKRQSTPSKEEFVYTDEIDFSDVDLASAWVFVPLEWTSCTSRIKEYDTARKTIRLVTPAGRLMSEFNRGFRLLNTRQGLRKPGMWMFENTGRRVIYWPCEGETPKNLDVYLSRSHSLIALGRSSGVRIEGLVLEGCSADPEFNNPYEHPMSAAVTMQRTTGATVDNCEIRNCAGRGVYGLSPTKCAVTRSHVHHHGAECVYYFDGGSASDVMWSELHDSGLLGVSKVLGMQLSDCRCVGNKIYNSPSCGAIMWSARSVFASNEVYHCMYASHDGGGLYGGFTDCVIHDNYVHDLPAWAGLYADEGSRRCVYYNNRFERCNWPIHMHLTQNIVVSNNVFKNDRAMRFSFQGSGHGVFCDNKIYATTKPTDDKYRENCDFWGRNRYYLLQPNGSYKDAGPLTLEPVRPAPQVCNLPRVPDGGRLPIGYGGRVDWDAFIRPMRWNGNTHVAADGHMVPGFPYDAVYVSYDRMYLYFGVVRRYSTLVEYPGMKNLTSTGWKHCDATRISFEGGRVLTVFPNGECETEGKMFSPAKDDLSFRKDGSFIVRIPLETLKVRGARRKSVSLEIETEDDGLLLADGSADVGRKSEKNLPDPVDVIGCSLNFNVTTWFEDFREEKSLFARNGKDYATGTLRFVEPPARN